MRKAIHHFRRTDAGFTIVELMVALSVLASLLLLASLTLISLGRLYSKNINQISAQNTARNIINDIASQIQLGGNVPAFSYGGAPGYTGTPASGTVAPASGDAPSSVRSLCIGNRRYTFVLNDVQGSSQSGYQHVLWRDSLSSSGVCPNTLPSLNLAYPTQGDAATVANSGSDLVPNNMRLTDLNVDHNAGSNTWTVKVTVAYGTKGNPPNASNDLVQFDSNVGDPNYDQTTCDGNVGTEFCALSSLTETVVQRVSQE